MLFLYINVSQKKYFCMNVNDECHKQVMAKERWEKSMRGKPARVTRNTPPTKQLHVVRYRNAI